MSGFLAKFVLAIVTIHLLTTIHLPAVSAFSSGCDGGKMEIPEEKSLSTVEVSSRKMRSIRAIIKPYPSPPIANRQISMGSSAPPPLIY